MKKAFLILITLFLSLQTMNYAFGQEVKQLSNEIRSTKDNFQKKNLLKKLWSIKPKSQTEVEDLIGIAETAKDNDEKKAALGALQNVNEENRQQLASAYTKALDSKDKDVRIHAIIGIGKMKAKEAAPKLREIVKSFGKTDYLAFKAMEKINPRKALEIIVEAGGATQTLGDIKDEDSIALLVDKYDELEEFAMEGLVSIGKNAIPALLELARKETDKRKDHPAQKALARINDKNAESDFIELFRNPAEEAVIRSIALEKILRDYKNRSLLRDLQNDYSSQTTDAKYQIIEYSNQKEDIPFLINILKKDKDPFSRAHAASTLGNVNDYSAVPALEEALKDWNSYVKDAASEALEKITGKKYEWRKK